MSDTELLDWLDMHPGRVLYLPNKGWGAYVDVRVGPDIHCEFRVHSSLREALAQPGMAMPLETSK